VLWFEADDEIIWKSALVACLLWGLGSFMLKILEPTLTALHPLVQVDTHDLVTPIVPLHCLEYPCYYVWNEF
jgi:hypothetical protein